MPVFAHLEGICHTYVDRDADLDMATTVVLNAKLRRTGRLRGDGDAARRQERAGRACCRALVKALLDAGCEVRGDAAAQQARHARQAARPRPTGRPSISTAIIAVKIVDGVDEAIAHIATLRLAAHRRHHHRQRRRPPSASSTARRFGDRAAQRLDAVRRRRRVRLRRRDRHRHRQAARARPRRRRAAHELQVRRARHGPDPADVDRDTNFPNSGKKFHAGFATGAPSRLARPRMSAKRQASASRPVRSIA